jgi:glycosyltransferase involved in cell wall biosynthesis
VHLGFPAENVVVVPPGVHERFAPSAASSRDASPLVVAAGRLSHVKRFDELLRAMQAVRASVPDARVEIVGDGPLRGDLERWITANDASQWAILRGRVSDEELVATYRRAWIVASASIAEGWGMTITEAGACGTPAVATDVAGHRGAVLDGITGDLVADTGDLASAIIALLDDVERRDLYGRNALARRDELTWDATAGRLLDVLLDDVRRRATSSRR